MRGVPIPESIGSSNCMTFEQRAKEFLEPFATQYVKVALESYGGEITRMVPMSIF